MNNLIASFSVSKIFIWSFIKLSSLQKSVLLNNCGVYRFFGDCNGCVKGVSSGIADEIFDWSFGDSKDSIDGFRDVFHKANGGGFSLGTICNMNCCICNMNCFHNGVYYKSFAV